MAHKVHPKSFRIKGIDDWDSRGFYGEKFPQYLEEDLRIREFLKKKIGKLGVEGVDIERFSGSGKINVIIFSARPGLIIGRGGTGIEELKKELEKKIPKNKEKRELKMEIREIKDPWASAPLVAQWVAQQIEKRMPFRRILKQAIEKVMLAKGNQGVRVEVAGRLNGAEIARTEYLKKGRLPRQTLRSDIDYIQDIAQCTYGVIGIKVWIYKGEKFEQ